MNRKKKKRILEDERNVVISYRMGRITYKAYELKSKRTEYFCVNSVTENSYIISRHEPIKLNKKL